MKKITRIEDRFFSKFKKGSKNSCWLWKGCIFKNTRYGYIDQINPRKKILAHRFSYEAHKGRIPEGKIVCHTCDIRNCVNPHHLWLGTQSDNIKDCIAKGRHARMAPRGEDHRNATLTWKQVHEIRNKYKRFRGACGLLAKEYGVNIRIIRNIVWRYTWKKE